MAEDPIDYRLLQGIEFIFLWQLLAMMLSVSTLFYALGLSTIIITEIYLMKKAAKL